jgi:hypothetical protein
MEPRALASANSTANSTPFKDQKEYSVPIKDTIEADTAQRALSELSLNQSIRSLYQANVVPNSMNPLESVSLQFARRKSFQHAPVVSSPLARKSWTPIATEFHE